MSKIENFANEFEKRTPRELLEMLNEAKDLFLCELDEPKKAIEFRLRTYSRKVYTMDGRRVSKKNLLEMFKIFCYVRLEEGK